MLTILTIFILLTAIFSAFMRHPKFGKTASGERLKRMQRSPNYKNGTFNNISITPSLTEGASFWGVMKEFFFKKKIRIKPNGIIPSKKTDLLHIPINQDILVWFGHSSYYMQVDGRRMLIDPVFSGSATPLPFGVKAFAGTDIYTSDEIPVIDYLFISHDHWDHLDYKTILQLKPKIKQVICGLGVGAHFEHWGFPKSQITELDWNEKCTLEVGFTIYTVPARHFSGRSFKRNTSLWLSFVLQTPTMKLFIGGDSGYDTHFAETGMKFGPFDLAILENGQYDKNWRYIHMLPGENIQAAKDLKAKRVFAVHSSKFALGNHSWDEPMITFTKNSTEENLSNITPMIGEQVNLKDENQQFSHWWEGVE